MLSEKSSVHVGRVMRDFFPFQRRLEFAAAIATLTGQFLGSTSLNGAVCYACATVLWSWLTIYSRMWGLMPLNVVSAMITGWTLWTLLL